MDRLERARLAPLALMIFRFACHGLAAFGALTMLACVNPITQTTSGGGADKPAENKLAPTISAISAANTPLNAAKAVGFTISDQDTNLSCLNNVSVHSSNFAITPVTSMILSGAAPNCTLTITPITNVFGTVTIDLTVNDGKFSATSSFSFTIVGGLTISGTPATTGSIGSAYSGFSVTGAGGLPPYTYSVAAGSLPAGVTLNASTGAVAGTPTVGGAFSGVTLRVTDSLGSHADLAAFELDVSSYEWDFTSAPVVDSTITYTRAGVGTRMGSAGLIEFLDYNSARYDYNPLTNVLNGLLIEGAQSNLFSFADRFDTSYWTKTRSTVTIDAGTAPDGTTTADKLVEDNTAGNTHLLAMGAAISKAASAIPYSFSIYAKAVEQSHLTLWLSSTTTANRVETTCTLSGAGSTAGTATQGAGWSNASSSITQLASGWYRCTLTGTSDTSTSLNAEVHLNDGTGDTYNGNGTSGLLLWGAQLEASTQPTSYIPTNNFLLQSEAFDTAATWVPSTVTVTADVATAPDGLSVTADSIQDNSGSLRLVTQTIAGIPNDTTTYMYSIYIRSTGATVKPVGLYMGFTGGTAVQYAIAVDASNCNFSTANVGSAPAGASVATVVGGGATWCRASFYGANNASGNTSMQLRIYPAYANALTCCGVGSTTNSVNAATDTHIFWGAQVEAVQAASPVVTPYSKRGNAASLHTRNQDSVIVGSLGTWFNASAGSFLSEVNLPVVPDASVAPTTVSFTDGTQNNRITQAFSSTGALEDVWVGGTQQTPATIALAPSGTVKVASSYNNNNLGIAMNNTLGTASSAASIPTVNQFSFGQLGNSSGFLNGTFHKMIYCPGQISNPALQSITQ